MIDELFIRVLDYLADGPQWARVLVLLVLGMMTVWSLYTVL